VDTDLALRLSIGLVISAVLGGLIGAERELHAHPAGMRTHLLVAVGCTLFTQISIYGFVSDPALPGIGNVDPSRVAAQIVTGIGFLGGGVILRESVGITGTTTAATIWITAAMGMAVGAGRAGAGLGLAAFIRGTLVVLHALEERAVMALPPTTLALAFRPDHGKTRIRIERMLVEFDARYELREREPRSADMAHARLTFRLPSRHARELLAQLAALPEVHEIQELPRHA
jgi:putative Mg2+ transporter-C (MgtC) family protein